ncbi:hypothetical protein NQ176_g3828 [Zarea fungicola]|uniref:Uncharacterized protein n=1 Tax=Zarea fungicola TaxID=93591 RepID=A0ACC1NGJ8_9HYPO|nr:hypothetical protein NQ176_g3828 [Lecanicillium fungicola]
MLASGVSLADTDQLADKLKLQAKQVFASPGFVIAFCEDATLVYNVRQSPPQQVASLEPPFEGFFRGGEIYLREGAVIVDSLRDAVIIVENQLHVWGLGDGRCQRSIGLFGSIYESVLYDNGSVLVATADEKIEDGETEEETWMLVCNPFNLEPEGYDFSSTACIPTPDRLQFYHPALFSVAGGILAGEHTSLTEQPLKLHYWKPATPTGADMGPPVSRTEIPISLPEAESIVAKYATTGGDDAIVLATLETVLDCPDGPGVHQSTIRLIRTPSLEIAWEADPIPGRISSLHYINECKVVIAIGKSALDVEDKLIHFTWIVALDAQTGQKIQFARLHPDSLGGRLVACKLVQPPETLKDIALSGVAEIILVTAAGNIAKLSLTSYLDDGLSSENIAKLAENVNSSKLKFQEVLRLDGRLSISHQCIAAVDDDGFLSIFRW